MNKTNYTTCERGIEIDSFQLHNSNTFLSIYPKVSQTPFQQEQFDCFEQQFHNVCMFLQSLMSKMKEFINLLEIITFETLFAKCCLTRSVQYRIFKWIIALALLMMSKATTKREIMQMDTKQTANLQMRSTSTSSFEYLKFRSVAIVC